jgi:chromosome segregation ATPase
MVAGQVEELVQGQFQTAIQQLQGSIEQQTQHLDNLSHQLDQNQQHLMTLNQKVEAQITRQRTLDAEIHENNIDLERTIWDLRTGRQKWIDMYIEQERRTFRENMQSVTRIHGEQTKKRVHKSLAQQMTEHINKFKCGAWTLTEKYKNPQDKHHNNIDQQVMTT